MKHRYQKPHDSLSDYVRTVLIMDGALPADPTSQPLVTNGMSALFFKSDGRKIQLTLFGTSVPPEYWETDPNTTIVAWFFKPFALSCVFNLDAKKLAANPVELPLVKVSPGIDSIIATLDKLLIEKLESNRRQCEIIRYATDHIMFNPGIEILSDIQKKLNLNERTFQRMFRKFVGITPVQYRRICQFETSFTQLRANEFGTFTDIAYDNGFADQSHFIRSFKEFTKTTPKNYLQKGLKS